MGDDAKIDIWSRNFAIASVLCAVAPWLWIGAMAAAITDLSNAALVGMVFLAIFGLSLPVQGVIDKSRIAYAALALNLLSVGVLVPFVLHVLGGVI